MKVSIYEQVLGKAVDFVDVLYNVRTKKNCELQKSVSFKKL